MVERVSSFEAKFHIHLLAYCELLAQRQVAGKCPGASDTAHRSRSISQRKIGRTLEDIAIDKVVVHPIRTVIALGCSCNVRPLRAVGRQRNAVGDGEGERASIGDAPDAVRLPSANDGFCPARHVAEQGAAVSEGTGRSCS